MEGGQCPKRKRLRKSKLSRIFFQILNCTILQLEQARRAKSKLALDHQKTSDRALAISENQSNLQTGICLSLNFKSLATAVHQDIQRKKCWEKEDMLLSGSSSQPKPGSTSQASSFLKPKEETQIPAQRTRFRSIACSALIKSKTPTIQALTA